MNIYECGNSVRNRILNQSVLVKNYVCVLEDTQEKTIKQAFEKTKEYLQNNLSLEISRVDEDSFTMWSLSGESYTISHEIVIKNEMVKYVPSNILRHVTSIPFTINGCYVNENNEIVKIVKNCEHNINGRFLHTLMKNFTNFLNVVPEYIITCFEYKYLYNYQISDYIYNCLCDITPAQPPKNLDLLKDLISKMPAVASEIEGNHVLSNYFVKNCGMKHSISFDTSNFVQPAKTKPPKKIEAGKIVENPNKKIQINIDKRIQEDFEKMLQAQMNVQEEEF